MYATIQKDSNFLHKSLRNRFFSILEFTTHCKILKYERKWWSIANCELLDILNHINRTGMQSIVKLLAMNQKKNIYKK